MTKKTNILNSRETRITEDSLCSHASPDSLLPTCARGCNHLNQAWSQNPYSPLQQAHRNTPMDQWVQNVKVKTELLGALRHPGEI